MEIENISKLIATINPDLYFDGTPSELAVFKSMIKKEGFDKAIGKAKARALEEHKLVYDSSQESLEPIYFWILDKAQEMYGNVEKVIDNFASSPGSGHFSELMSKGTVMHEKSMSIMQTIGIMIKSILNIIYDLKEFKIRLSHYKAARSKNSDEAQTGMLSLKQMWMDNVDMKRGNTSIKAMAAQFQFVTLIDAFMAAKSTEDVDKMDLNDRVKRFLKPRMYEFFEWKKRSEVELTKRYEIEKTYLKSQVNSLKLYTRWVKPYLRAASQLEMRGFGNPSLVTAFNTILFELTLLGKKPIDFSQAVVDKDLPKAFEKVKLKRKYYQCIVIDFTFRGIPQKVGQHYGFGGKSEVTFKAFALNDDELKMLKDKLEDSDMNEGLKLAEGITTDSLELLREDIEYFLEEEEEVEKKEASVDPFTALFSGLRKKEEKKPGKRKEKITEIKPDNFTEKAVRAFASRKAQESCFVIFDVYKKAHGMPSHQSPFD